MPSNLPLIVIGVFFLGFGFAMVRIRRRSTLRVPSQYDSDAVEAKLDLDELDVLNDEIISERKVEQNVYIEFEAEEDEPVSTPRQPVYVIYLKAPDKRMFAGSDLLQALLSEQLHFGKMDIFHRIQEMDGNPQTLFSVASLNEPGTFDLESISSNSFAGLAFFMETDSNLACEAFDIMYSSAQSIQAKLKGQLLNQQGQPLSEVEIAELKAQLAE